MATSKPVGEHSAPSHPLLQFFYRRKQNHAANVKYIVGEGHELFNDVPIDELVSLAFFSTPTHLKTFARSNPELWPLVLRIYESDENSDLFRDWQFFCKTIGDRGRRSEYLLEGAIKFGTEQIPQSWQHLWQLRSRELLQLLRRGRTEQTTRVDGQPTHRLRSSLNEHLGAESPTAFTSFLDTDSWFIARMPDVSRLQITISNFLYIGMSMSFKRAQEKHHLTDAVRLHVAGESGGDFKLEIFVSTHIARAITDAIRDGNEELLRIMLGDYLAEGMDGSLWKQEEKHLGIPGPTAALRVVPTEDEDYRLFIMLRFSTGQELFGSLFPI
ncbi:hypothetical protein Forpi1262_v017186 [Fusarium oxysporum f. sp. raphani]|uniref:Uncharacterized protein n=1 Tax=Fusarium oxysporum f. sp. raphani TaxID=96318 RepID=A0A8J5TSJ7_FUSOX|nr:hypothetical protein Forpi1262_v017186 [Fusarium oxysporum f. sp. raphani]